MTRVPWLVLSALLLSSCAETRTGADGQEQVLAAPVTSLHAAVNQPAEGHAMAFASELPWTVKGLACQRLEVALEFLPAPPATIAAAVEPEDLERKLWATPVACLRLDCKGSGDKDLTLVHELPPGFANQPAPTLWITDDGQVRTTVGTVHFNVVGFKPVVAVDLAPMALVRRRAADPRCAAVRTGMGPHTCWASFAEPGVGAGSIGTLTFFPRDPATATTAAEGWPESVWFLGLRRDGSWLPARPELPWILRDQPCGPPAMTRNESGMLQEVRLAAWTPPIDPLLDGEDADLLLPPRQFVPEDLRGMRIARMRGAPATPGANPGVEVPAARLRIEELSNERLVEWKGRELAGRLSGPGARPAELATRVEKGLLRIDLKVRQLKDAIDAEARKPDSAAPRALSDRCHLLEQRKAILTAILQIVRKAGG